LFFDNNYFDPELGIYWNPVTQLPYQDVQRALSWLTRMVLPLSEYQYCTVNSPVGPNTLIVGVNVALGSVTIQLPLPEENRKITVKHELGTLGVANAMIIDPNGLTIDGAAGSLTFNDPANDHISISLYSDGYNWFII